MEWDDRIVESAKWSNLLIFVASGGAVIFFVGLCIMVYHRRSQSLRTKLIWDPHSPKLNAQTCLDITHGPHKKEGFIPRLGSMTGDDAEERLLLPDLTDEDELFAR